MPAEVRRALGLQAGDRLDITVHPKTRSVSIKKPLSVEELSAKYSQYIKPGTQPILNVDEYYQKHRTPRA